jgi:DNA-binding NarL/FixJ family response regulator
VATELLDGRTNAQIAQRLGVGAKSVEQHVRGILRALDVDSRAAAVARLVGDGEAVVSGIPTRG